MKWNSYQFEWRESCDINWLIYCPVLFCLWGNNKISLWSLVLSQDFTLQGLFSKWWAICIFFKWFLSSITSKVPTTTAMVLFLSLFSKANINCVFGVGISWYFSWFSLSLCFQHSYHQLLLCLWQGLCCCSYLAQPITPMLMYVMSSLYICKISLYFNFFIFSYSCRPTCMYYV